MTGQAIGKNLNYGWAGATGNSPEEVIEPKVVDENSANIVFGRPVRLIGATNKVTDADGSLTAANFLGIAKSEIRQFNSYSPTQNATQQGFYGPQSVCDVAKKGDFTVKCAHGTPTAGGPVFIRTVLDLLNFPNEVVGDFRADDDPGNCIQLDNACWATPNIDGNNIAMLRLKWVNN